MLLLVIGFWLPICLLSRAFAANGTTATVATTAAAGNSTPARPEEVTRPVTPPVTPSVTPPLSPPVTPAVNATEQTCYAAFGPRRGRRTTARAHLGERIGARSGREIIKLIPTM